QPDARSPAPRSPMRSRRIPRCPTCGLSPGLCICAELPRIVTRTHVRVIAHRKEQFKSTNTGKLSARMLEGAAFECRTDPPRVAEAMAPYTWVLFPSEDALSLREAAALGVHTLLVPDGTWNQAKR